MAGPFYVDDGGDGTTEDSWATADTSINALDAEYAFASGEIVYFGHDHVCQATNTGSLTITGPASGPPVLFISATQGSSPATYAASSSNQIDTTEGAYSIIFDGSFALYGMQLVSGSNIVFVPDGNEPVLVDSCKLKPAANGYVSLATTLGKSQLVNCTIDLSADGTTNRSGQVFFIGSGYGSGRIVGATFVNAQYRTGEIIRCDPGINTAGFLEVSACDFSGFTNATACEIFNTDGPLITHVVNCLTAATWTALSTAYPTSSGEVYFVNVGPADDPTALIYRNFYGDIVSSSTIYRSTGATVEAINTSWYVTTRATFACESTPFFTPWIYGTIASTGSKTFDMYITNDTADFDDDEVWLEVEFLGTSDEAQSTLATDRRSSITATAAAQTDDTTSTWTDNDTGISPSFTYKQKLSVTATVNEAGAYRARVAVGVASIATTRYFFIDPKVTVS